MAKKSKTQRAKASAARAARKEQARAAEAAAAEAKRLAEEEASKEAEKSKKGLMARFRRNKPKEDKAQMQAAAAQAPKKKTEEKKKKKRHWYSFIFDVRAEMKRVTWPTRQDVVRWSVVVVVALLFFGVYVALLDNVVITPILVGFSNIGG